ncbi:DUF6434 domain-containing protein [Pantoea ananatis]|uniref:DUF6434 domain-containing protein n=1 Tax=Pantoea ananas TaxID=553 RepID=UPI0007DAC606|nr:DUF6434 domain-containing protein [Pantoea ananatis]UYL00245.1 DUF6434 domain-containing protein [Pantoea ananatis]
MKIDWHSTELTRMTVVDENDKNTQNVRRFLVAQCGERFRFDRDFTAWIRNEIPKNLGEVVDEWKRRKAG